MQGIPISVPSFSTHYLRMIPFGSDAVMSTGTGFIYEYEDELFLITNGHNITRTNPEQTRRLTDTAAYPVKIKSKTRMGTKEIPEACFLTDFFEISLYKDDEYKEPEWYVHPEKGYLIDVVAVSIGKKDSFPEHIKFFPINKYKFNDNFQPIIADDIFILGYPFNLSGMEELPIWKRGTIASEPSLDMDDLPKIFVDTASRSGMSGSPVIMKRTGVHNKVGKEIKDDTIFGTITNFIGIYSGRIGAENEFKAQLGIVWKKEVIEEILSAKVKGDIKFQTVN
jgi:hypothetical protein